MEIKLTPEQTAVVNHRGTPALVVAGAGSGKTQTVTSHVASLIQDGIEPESIMMLTFTRKAAEEMRERIKTQVLEEQANKIIAGTFHSIGVRMLRRFGWEIDPQFLPGIYVNDFDVLGKGESADSLDLVRTRFNRTYATTYNCDEDIIDDLHLPSSDAIEDFFSQCKNRQMSFEDGLNRLSVARKWKHPETLTYLENLYKVWSEQKIEDKTLNYDDILEAWSYMATNRPETCRHIKALIIDEAQDMNNIQHDIAHAIYSNMQGQHIMLVGDAAQSIYGWRGANVHAFDEFNEVYPNSTQYQLSKNFRSYQPVLDKANNVLIGCNIKSTTKLSSVRGTGPNVTTRSFYTQKDQAKEILRIIRQTPNDSNIAVIARSSQTLHMVEPELIKYNINYEFCGGKPLSEQTPVRDIMAMLRFAYGQMNEASLCRLLKLFDTIGDKIASYILDSDLSTCLEHNYYTNKRGQRADAVNNACKILSLTKTALQASPWPETMETAIKIYRKILVDAEASATKRVFKEKSTQKQHERENAFQQDILTRLDDVIAPILIEIAKDSPSAVSFADDFKIERPQTQAEGEAKVTLTTIHSAKGLEWDRVIVADCTDTSFSAKKDMFQNQKDFNDEQEEQRRCLYVAVTRAKNELWCLWPKQTLGQNSPNKISRYLGKQNSRKTYTPAYRNNRYRSQQKRYRSR